MLVRACGSRQHVPVGRFVGEQRCKDVGPPTCYGDGIATSGMVAMGRISSRMCSPLNVLQPQDYVRNAR